MVFSKRFALKIPSPLPREGMLRVQIPSMAREFVVPKRGAIYSSLMMQLYPQAKPTRRQFNRVLGSYRGELFDDNASEDEIVSGLIESGFLHVEEVYAGSTKDDDNK